MEESPKNPKLQIPNTKKIPSSKFQTSRVLSQNCRSRREGMLPKGRKERGVYAASWLALEEPQNLAETMEFLTVKRPVKQNCIVIKSLWRPGRAPGFRQHVREETLTHPKDLSLLTSAPARTLEG